MSYSYTPLYYGEPIQVRFYDWRCGEERGGIAYHNHIIIGDGDVVKIQMVIEQADIRGIDFDDAIIEMSWVDLEKMILGKEL